MSHQQITVEQLIPLLETEKRWKETNVFKKMLEADNTECVEGLINNLDEIISGKQYPPMARLGAMRLLKICLEAGSQYFNFMVTEGDLLDKLVGYAKIKPNTNIFSAKPDKRETQVSVTLFTYIVEGFLFWNNWFPGTKFETLFNQLKKEGVAIPDQSKVQIFKADIFHLYNNGIFQKKKAQIDDAQQQKHLSQKQQKSTPTQGGGEDLSNINETIEQQIIEYDTMKELMTDMIENMENPNDLALFSEKFNNFSNFTDSCFRGNQKIKEDLQERLMVKGEECLELCQAIEQFYTQQISFEQMKKTLLDIAKVSNQANQKQNRNQEEKEEDRFKELEEQEKKERGMKEQKRLQEKQQLEDEQEQQRKQQALEEQQQREREDRQKKQQILLEQQKKDKEDQLNKQRQQEEQARKQKEQEELLKQREHEEQIKRQKEQEEQIKRQKEQEEQVKRQKEQEEQIKRQKEQEELNRRKKEQEELIRRQKEEEDILQRQKDEEERRKVEEQERVQRQKVQENERNRRQEEEHQRQLKQAEQNRIKLEEEERKKRAEQEELHKMKEQEAARKPSNQKFVVHDIGEEEYEDEEKEDEEYEERKSNYMKAIKPSPPPPQVLAQQMKVNSQMEYKKVVQNPNLKATEINEKQFHVDDDVIDFADDDDDDEQYQAKNIPSQNAVKPSNMGEIIQNQNKLNSNALKNQFQNQPNNQKSPDDYNPFPTHHQNNSFQQSDKTAKTFGHYFYEEEFYEQPKMLQINQNHVPKANLDQKTSKDLDESVRQGESEAMINKQLKQSNLNLDDVHSQSQRQSAINFYQPETTKQQSNESSARLPANPKIPPLQISNELKPTAQLSFQPAPTYQMPSSSRNQVNPSEKIQIRKRGSNENNQLNSSRFNQALSNNQLWEDKSQLRSEGNDERNLSNVQDKKIPVFSKDKQLMTDLNNLKNQINDIRRDKDLEISKLQIENQQLNMHIRELEAQNQMKESQQYNNEKLAGQERNEFENKLKEKDGQILKQKQEIQQLEKEQEKLVSITKQYEQQKQESYQIIQSKKQAMEQENQKTKQQLQDYINNTQKSYKDTLDGMQEKLNEKEKEASKYSKDLHSKEMENQEIKNQLRLLKSKQENDNSQQLLKEKDLKIIELRNQIDVLTHSLKDQGEKSNYKNNEVLGIRKELEDFKEALGNAESQVSIVKENNVQKDIQIHTLKQEAYDFQQKLQIKEMNQKSLESQANQKADMLDQYKKASELQLNKFKERLEERDHEIQQLSKQNHELENKLDNMISQHREDLNRIVAASKMSEEEKGHFKVTAEENERLKKERAGGFEREKKLLDQIEQLQNKMSHLQKEYELQENNLGDILGTNNLLTKKLYERDEHFAKLQENQQQQFQETEKKHLQENKQLKQTIESLKQEKQKREADQERQRDTLRKENELLLNSLQTKTFLSTQKFPFNLASPVSQDNNLNELSHDQGAPAMMTAKKSSQKLMSPSFEVQQVGEELTSYKQISQNNNQYQVEVNNSNQNKSQRSVPQKFFGKENIFNPTYFSYLKGEKQQMYRFKKACLKNKICLYQDGCLNVNAITEAKEIEDKSYVLITLFFENKSVNLNMTAFQVTYDGDKSVNLFKKPSTLPAVISESSQHQQQIMTDYNEMPYKILQCTVKYCVNSIQTQAVFALPNCVNKFFQVKTEATQHSISEAFSKYTHLLNWQNIRLLHVFNLILLFESSEEIKVDRNIVSSQSDYPSYFSTFVSLPVTEQLSDYQCIAGQYFMKSINTNFWLKVNFHKKQQKMLFQIVQDQQDDLNSIGIMKYFLQTLIYIFKE